MSSENDEPHADRTALLKKVEEGLQGAQQKAFQIQSTAAAINSFIRDHEGWDTSSELLDAHTLTEMIADLTENLATRIDNIGFDVDKLAPEAPAEA